MKRVKGKVPSNIFMLGVGGSGMRGLAFLLKGKGMSVTGIDRDYNRARADKGLARSELLIYSDAVAAEHPVRQMARSKGVPELAYHEAVGELAAGYTTIAVAGTHGKSSTTAMLAHIMIEAGLDPTVLVGASVPAWGGQNARTGTGKYLVVEADEYRDHFLALKPAYAVVTNIDYDHPDYFASLDEVKKSFDKFLRQVSGSVVTYRQLREKFAVGEHMQYNAALAVAMAEKLGLERDQAEEALKSWQGLGRRMEELGDLGGRLIVSDYGHHPVEITATLKAARKKYGGKKILVLFEAHTLERLIVFETEFTEALSKADGVLLVPVFIPVGREQETQEAEKRLVQLEQVLSNKRLPTWRISGYKELPGKLRKLAGEFDMALAFTAGDLDNRLRALVD